jgi:hypothetical protein
MVEYLASFLDSPDNQGVTYEEICDIVRQRHRIRRIGDSDIM